ncbi:MAG: hypothetical protein LUG18_13965 [Candidatus Azobacteroides sp.]|nr:hypothetical protein [Candidatus Azobacteroides sp.]
METTLKLIKKTSVVDSLLTIDPGHEVFIRTRNIKATAIYSAVRRLNRKGYAFIASEAGLIDEVKVARIR